MGWEIYIFQYLEYKICHITLFFLQSSFHCVYCLFLTTLNGSLLLGNLFYHPNQWLAYSRHLIFSAAAAAKLFQSCPTLCDPIDSSPPGSPIPGILQARALEWVAISFSNAWKWKVKVKLLSRVQLSDPVDCSLPGSSVHGIFQTRVLEWVAIAFPG